MTRALTVVDSATQDSSVSTEKSKIGAWSDWLGMAAAIGCAIHCAAMPFVIAYLPALGLNFLADEGFHQWMAIGCFAIAVSAFVPGFRKHRSLTPVIIGSFGLAMISFAAFGSGGACCAAHESHGAQVAATDAHCEGCATECETACATECESHTAGGSVDGANTVAWLPFVSPSWLGFVLPWLTPVGGFVLIAAHLLNRRQCSCCGSAMVAGVPSEATPASVCDA